MILENQERRQREREIDQLPPVHSPIRDGTPNLAMCPDWELNPPPFGARDNAPTEQRGQDTLIKKWF